jgi:endonuclease I
MFSNFAEPPMADNYKRQRFLGIPFSTLICGDAFLSTVNRLFILAVALAVGRLAYADAPLGYYDSVTNQTGLALREALHHVIKNHNVIRYSGGALNTSDALKVLDANPSDTNFVVLIYNGSSAPLLDFGIATGWNREHVWPNSYGLDDVEPSYSDLHNLRACDANVNSSRGNKYFDTTTTNGTGFAFPAHIEAPLCSTDFDSWEPPILDRGNIARSIFYMVVRYMGGTTNEPLLLLTDNPDLIKSTNAYMGRLSTLLKWHTQDPVDDAERLRNDLVYSLYQTNRNPFVDRPEWVSLAFAPRLSIAGISPNLVVEWAGDFIGANLEGSTNLHSPWTAVTNTAFLTNGNWRVILPNDDARRFLRVRIN